MGVGSTIQFPHQVDELIDFIAETVVPSPTQQHREAIEEYQRMREDYYGSYSYDFRDFVLANVAESIARENTAGAIQFLDFNMELFPESVNTLFTMAQIHQATGDNSAAIRALERALVLDPDNSFYKQMIERLRGN